MKRCLDEGLLQAYVDGELSPEQACAAAAHLAACDVCASALASAESENALFATALAPDESINVPTEVLRARLSAAVAQLEAPPAATRDSSRNRSAFGGFLASLSAMFTFTPQRAAGFAGLLVIFAVATILFVVQKSQQTTGDDQIAKNEIANPIPVKKGEGIAVQPGITPQPVATPEVEGAAVGTPVGYKPGSVNRKKAERRRVAPPRVKEEFLQGEKDYQTAIASLEKTIKMGGDAVLSPSVRVKYERNVAILDSAIGESRRVAAANPKDKDAVGFLMAAYQSKIELLTKVADQAQVAAVGR